MCKDFKWSLFYITKSGTYSRKLVWKNKLPGPALGVCFAQCLHLNDYRSIGLLHLDDLHLDDCQSIGSFPQSKFQVYDTMNRFATWQTGFHWVSAFVKKIPNTASLSQKFYCQSIHSAKKKPFSAQGGGSCYCSSALRSLEIRGSGLLGPSSPRLQANLQRQPATLKTHLQHPNLTLFHLQLEMTCPLSMDIHNFP